MKKIVRFVLLLGTLSMILSVAFCSAKPAAKAITMRFSWWGDEKRNQATLQAIELYHKLHPEITIEGETSSFDSYYQKLLTQLVSRTAPDIVQIDYKWVGDLMSRGENLFTNINDLSKTINLSKFDLKPVRGYIGKGKYMIGIPVGINGRGLFYNTEFFTKFNIKAGNDWTWDKMLEIGAKVNKQDKNAHLLYFEKNAVLYLVQTWIKQKYGADMFTEDYTMAFNEQDLVDSFTYIQKLVDTGTVPPFEEMVPYDSVYSNQVPNWLNGQWGMSALSASNLPPIIAASPFTIGTMRWMIMPGAKDSGIVIAPTQLLSVNNNSPNKMEAAKFINWFINDDRALAITKDTRGIPVNTHARKLLEDQGIVPKPVSSMLAQALTRPGSVENAVTLNPQLLDITRQYIYKVGLKRLTPKDAARQAMADYKTTLDTLKKSK
jgi:oligogalacturonide transport system substrate-binding protein